MLTNITFWRNNHHFLQSHTQLFINYGYMIYSLTAKNAMEAQSSQRKSLRPLRLPAASR